MRYGLLIGAVVAGCGRDAVSEYEPNTLEKSTVDVDAELEHDQRYDWTGALAVDGSGADFDLQVDTTSIAVHTSGRAPLGALDGMIAHVQVAPEPLSNELSIAIMDEDDELYYLLEPVVPGPLTNERFGAGQVARANDLGEVLVDGWQLTLHSAWLRTDAGDVELLPGVPQEVSLGGATFRAVLVDAFEAELQLDGDVQCTGASDRLAFELVRVEPGTSDLAELVRADDDAVPTSTCTSAP